VRPEAQDEDGAGVVEEVGSEVKLFKVGDEVFFAGVINRNGTNAEYTAVDERIVGRKPKNFSWEQAAAVPLTGLTAWEGLECQLGIKPNADNSQKTILVIAGAGGVGSIVIPLAKKVFNLKVVATASRPETVEYSKKLGADVVVNHKEDILEQLKQNGISGVDYIFNTANNDENFDQIVPSLNTFGRIVAITGANKPINTAPLFGKCGSISYELMFTRGLTGVDIEKQHEILNNLADLVEKGIIPDRATTILSLPKDIVAAHNQQAKGDNIGKIVLTTNF